MHERWPVKDGEWNYTGIYTGMLGGCKKWYMYYFGNLYIHFSCTICIYWYRRKRNVYMESNVYESSNKQCRWKYPLGKDWNYKPHSIYSMLSIHSWDDLLFQQMVHSIRFKMVLVVTLISIITTIAVIVTILIMIMIFPLI